MNEKMRKIVTTVLMITCALVLLAVPIEGKAANTENPFDALEQLEDKVSEALENMDEETVEDIFSFLKEKTGDGTLDSEEGIQKAVEQAREKFGVEIDRADAQRLVDTMEKLEDMGFSAEDIIQKTEGLYQTYGANFMEHMEEGIADAVKKTVTTAVSSFFERVFDKIGNFFQNIF